MIYERIDELCKKNKTSITALCIETTGSSGNLKTWKKDNIRLNSLISICKKFKVSADFILGIEESPIAQSLELEGQNHLCSIDEQTFLGCRIKQLRKEKRMTQQELGTIVDLHGSNIGRIEQGKVYPTSDVILKICQYFSVSCDWLLTGGEKTKYNFCNNADSVFLHLFGQLTDNDKEEIEELIKLKINRYKKENSKNARSSALTDSLTG